MSVIGRNGRAKHNLRKNETFFDVSTGITGNNMI